MIKGAFFALLAIATVALLRVHRRTRMRGHDLSVSAAIATGVILGLMALEIAIVGICVAVAPSIDVFIGG